MKRCIALFIVTSSFGIAAVHGQELYFSTGTNPSADPSTMIFSTSPAWAGIGNVSLVPGSVLFEDGSGAVTANPAGSNTLIYNTTTLNHLEGVAQDNIIFFPDFDPANFTIDDSYPDLAGNDNEFLTTGEDGDPANFGGGHDDPDDTPDLGVLSWRDHQNHLNLYSRKRFTITTTFEIDDVARYENYFLDARLYVDGNVDFQINGQSLISLGTSQGTPFYRDPGPQQRLALSPTNLVNGTNTVTIVVDDHVNPGAQLGVSGMAGYARLGASLRTQTVSGNIFDDADGNGTFGGAGSGEELAAITVNLLDAGGNIVDTIQTGADGSYTFSDVLPGDYTISVDETTLPGNLQGKNVVDPDGTPDSQTAITVTLGVDLTDQNFGYMNNLPDAQDDTITDPITSSAPMVLNILADNGSGPDDFGGDGPSTMLLIDPASGNPVPLGTSIATARGGEVVILDPNGTPNDPMDDLVIYTPPDTGGATVSDSFEYQICDVDGAPDCDIATVTISSVTTPVTLGLFEAVRGANPGDVAFSWQTVTEVGNLGFNLYVREGKGENRTWRKVNPELIPSQLGDSIETQTYRYAVTGVKGKRFALGDVDVYGKETLHGPFRLGESEGMDRSQRQATDWEAIKTERKTKRKERKAKRQQRLEHKLQRRLDSGERQMRQQSRNAP